MSENKMKKYELTTNVKTGFGRKLFQIKALVSFGDVTAGDLGGYIEKEENLSHDDNAWVYDDAWVFGDALVFDNARVFGDARVCGDAWVCGDARVCGDADYICFKGFGSENRNTTIFRTKNGDVYVCCGCFRGSLKEFSEKVKKTHGSSKYAKEYMACVEVAKIHFEIGEENDK